MGVLPRIVTIDPSGELSRIVRATFDLTERSVIQIDIPDVQDALDEIHLTAPQVVICALEVDETMRGIDLAMMIRQAQPETQVIVIANAEDPDELDEASAPDSAFVYLRRPLEAPRFVRALFAALDGEDARMTMATQAVRPVSAADLGPMPHIDLNAAQRILQKFGDDVLPMAILLANRRGETLLELGTIGFDSGQLITGLLPAVITNVEIGQFIGGSKPSTVQFFDGETLDVFVLSVGLHFFLCVIYDGAQGNRNFGSVTRFGRRAVEDMIAPLGASAFMFERPTAPPEESRRRRPRQQPPPTEEQVTQSLAVKAEEWAQPEETPPTKITTAIEIPRVEPIPEIDLDVLAGGGGDEVDLDDLFDPDKLAEIANEQRGEGGRGPLTYDQARELGILQ